MLASKVIPAKDIGAGSVSRTVISVDAMGGDLGPAAVVAGCARFARGTEGIGFILHGPKEELQRLVSKKKALAGLCRLRHSDRTVTMDARPSHVMRNGRGTSMWSAIDSVRNGEAEVCVSCGNTGALMAVSMMRLRKLDGINRPAIACLWPRREKEGFNIMLDVGADIRADQDDLLQFALMGTSYARNSLDLARPRVGLLNVGTEENKGRAELKVANELIAAAASAGDFDYVGFIEGGDIPSTKVNVIVTDGFTGNIALKTAEGTAEQIREFLKSAFAATPLSRIAALVAYTSLNRLNKRIDPRRVNGGVFLGLNGIVVKSHGGADARGITAAVKLAFDLARSRLSERLAARIASATTARRDAMDSQTRSGLGT